jgi:hypothetical protein
LCITIDVSNSPTLGMAGIWKSAMGRSDATATAIWDVSYAYRRREVTPTEQHVHASLEMLPLMGVLIVVQGHGEPKCGAR